MCFDLLILKQTQQTDNIRKELGFRSFFYGYFTFNYDLPSSTTLLFLILLRVSASTSGHHQALCVLKIKVLRLTVNCNYSVRNA
jgi:hypothetical protein